MVVLQVIASEMTRIHVEGQERHSISPKLYKRKGVGHNMNYEGLNVVQWAGFVGTKPSSMRN